MRMIIGSLGLSLVIIIIFLAQSQQLDSLKKIPEVSKLLFNSKGGNDLAESPMNPKKIIESFKKSMAKVTERNKALLEGELPSVSPEDTVDPAAESPISPEEKGKELTASAITSTELKRYGMDLKKLTAEEAQPYLGKWSYQTQTTKIQFHLKPDRSISSVALRVIPHTDISFGQNTLPLWKNSKTGQVILILNEDEYIHWEGEPPHFRGHLYQKKFRGARKNIPLEKAFQKSLDFPLRSVE